MDDASGTTGLCGGSAGMKTVDPEFLKEQAERCRRLAEQADPFMKERLLKLAEEYDKRYQEAKRQ
jgi:hypothetical protein